MGHGGVADEIKGRRGVGAEATGAILSIDEQGVRFRSYIDGSRAVPRTRDLDGRPGRAGIGHRARVRRVHAVSRHARLHGALDRTDPPVARALLALARRGGACRQRVYGIVQGGVEHELRVESAGAVAASGCDGMAIGGSLGQDKPQMYEVVAWTTAELERLAPDRPRHLLGIGDIDDLIAGVELGIDTFDCAMPTRLGRHGVAVVPDPCALAGRSGEGPLARASRSRSSTAARARLLRRLLARIHPLPAARRRDDRTAARDAAQPQLRGAADGGPAGGDRFRDAARGRGRAARGRRSGRT